MSAVLSTVDSASVSESSWPGAKCGRARAAGVGQADRMQSAVDSAGVSESSWLDVKCGRVRPLW